MEVKGTLLKNTEEWVVEKYGMEKWRELVAAMKDDIKNDIADGTIFSGNWYPIDGFIEVNEKIVQMFGGGNFKILYDMTKEGAKKNMKSIYRIFIKVATPEYVVKKAAAIYSQLYNFGEMKVVKQNKGDFILEIQNINNFPILFERMSGYIMGIVEMTSARNPRIAYTYDRNSRKAVYEVLFS